MTVTWLVYCIRTTTTDQPYAFFGTPARAWQLAAGALTALAVPALVRCRPRTRAALGGAGLVLLGLSVLLLKESGSGDIAYPSYLALAPTLAGVLLIASGTGAYSRLNRALSVRPLIGDLSYSLSVALARAGHRDGCARRAYAERPCSPRGARRRSGIAVLHLVENPVRRSRVLVRRPARSIALGAVLVIAGSFLPVAAYASQAQSIDRVVVDEAKGSGEPVSHTITPSLQDAVDDEGPFKDMGCQIGFDQTTTPSWDGCTLAAEPHRQR